MCGVYLFDNLELSLPGNYVLSSTFTPYLSTIVPYKAEGPN